MDLDEIQKKVNANVVSNSRPQHDETKNDPKTGKAVVLDCRQQPRGIDQLRKKVFFFQQ